jgi:DNA-binding SARP family transcriptional activator
MAGHADPELRIALLGAFKVSFRGRDLTDQIVGRSRAVFEYLVVTAAPVSRDVLIELCWPGFDPERGRNNLNVAITGIRRAFAWTGIVQHRGGTYRINPHVATVVDTRAFFEHLHEAHQLDRAGERAAAIEAYRAAVELHTGELLPEERYTDWVAPHRAFVQHAHLDAIKRLTLLCLDAGDLFGASWAAQLGLLVDDLDEELVECWLKTLADRRAVRRLNAAFARYSTRLADELGLRPPPHLAALGTGTNG